MPAKGGSLANLPTLGARRISPEEPPLRDGRSRSWLRVPASDDNLEWALDLEADRMINSFISAEDL
ncbi:MAG: hypothetical protein OXG71_00170, partial [Rhodospirillales bacterium]|nr:hypothetical protein [Rhodospirillales bacterium]